MIVFYLNEKLIQTDIASATTLLDFVRSNQKLKGTKIGCREGDCGACTVLVGSLQPESGDLVYKSINSCLTPIANAQNKHIVTIEGINNPNGSALNTIQQSFVDNGASQCGFCTPGFIMSATGFFLPNKASKTDKLIDFLDGNICRCTGYHNIVKAVKQVADAAGGD